MFKMKKRSLLNMASKCDFELLGISKSCGSFTRNYETYSNKCPINRWIITCNIGKLPHTHTLCSGCGKLFNQAKDEMNKK
jgi:hypothetical protein